MGVGKFPVWISPLLAIGVYSVLLWFEHRRPLRRTVESKLTRSVRNLAVASLSAVAVQVAELPVAMPLAALVERRGWGVINLVRLPAWAEVALAPRVAGLHALRLAAWSAGN